jgi:hypothetical protein
VSCDAANWQVITRSLSAWNQCLPNRSYAKTEVNPEPK